MDKNIVNKYAYDTFGAVLNSMEGISSPFKYVGAYGVMDEGNGLLYMRARYYDWEAGRFISKDPIGLAGGINQYVYAGNSPVNYIDPSGLDALPSPADKIAAETTKANHPELWKKKNDKFAHCALACQITKDYGPWTAHNVALWKEVRDKYDCNPKTNYEQADYAASLEGVKIAISDGDCIKGCIGAGYVQ